MWLSLYQQAAGGGDVAKRFRDWGTLRYLLRGIAECMPFIERVHLVVAAESQVPTWIDRERVHIVLHADIIPSSLLPLFNSCTIEMFLHRIDGLAEEYLYFNDDMFPLQPSQPADFFADGKAKIGLSHHLFATGLYKQQCRTSDRLARRALGLKTTPFFVRPQHICSPMLRSVCEEAFALLEADIMATASCLREPHNPNQYLFLDYMYYSHRLLPRRISNRHISQGVWQVDRIAAYIASPSTRFACINDVEMPDAKFLHDAPLLQQAFQARYPTPSPFEL